MISCSWLEEEMVRGTVHELNHQSDRHLLNDPRAGRQDGGVCTPSTSTENLPKGSSVLGATCA